jgi:uncharacterized protein YbjQ (UPF0145 family)
MKKLISTMLVLAAAAGTSVGVQGADRATTQTIAAAMAANDAQARLGSTVRFYFGTQAHPAVIETLGTDKTSQKTNAFAKSDEKACHWAFLSAMLRLEKRAKDLGANAVINIVSNYNNVESSSQTEFECHAGGIMAGVALKGDFVKIPGS